MSVAVCTVQGVGQDSAPARLAVHVAERADVLADGLADLLAAPPDDPFAPELVAVENPGVGRWVAQRLSHRLGAAGAADGIAAQIRFDPWWRVVAQVLAGVVGLDRRDDPWHPDRLVWQVLAAVDDHLNDPWLSVVRHHLGDDPSDEVRRGRRLQTARHVAGLFTAYDARRPALLADWAAGHDTDGAGTALPDDLVWQARLWRAVANRLGTLAPSQRLAEAAERLHDDPALAPLPPRLSVFAPGALPDAHLRVLDALAVHRDVHLWLVHPSAALWRRVAQRADLHPTGPLRRRDLPVPARHRLLSSMSGPATELQLRVAPLAGQVTVTAAPRRPTTVLGTVQQALADDRPTHGSARHDDEPDRPALSTADRSVQVHACHGRMRQVEVLRDVLTGLFADDPTLEPRDVVVLCPDVAGFAPLVEAVFDPVDEADGPTAAAPVDPLDQPSHPGRLLRVRVADRTSTGQPTNPLLGVLGRVLALASSRVTASAVLDLARSGPVRRRFGLDDDALARVQEWTAESGVHWGEDATRRARYHVHQQQGTWAAGLDRLLLGVAMAEEDQRYLGAVLPVDDVSSADVDLVGRWTELLDRLTGLLAQLSGTHPVAHWLDTCETALTLLTDTTTTDRWQQVEAAQALAQVRERVADDAVPLRLADLVALLRPALAGRGRRSGYRTGALTVCGFAPLRGVPHRVVVLLGMDDGAFPRRGADDGDDVTARDPLVGEPDPRAGDRQLFCDAVAAATQRLVVVHCGADERTGAPRVPCVPVAELLDAVDDAVALHHPDGRPATARDLVMHHPLHPVDPRAFGASAGSSAGPTSYDRTALAAARALVAARAEPPQPRPFLAPPLDWPPHGPAGSYDPADGVDVELASLVAALQHPVGAFVRDRLGVTLPGATELADDRLPLEVDGLARWAAGDRILRAALAGADLAVASAAERRRGHLPPAALGQHVAAEVYAEAASVQQAAAGYLTEPPRSVAVTVDLPGGRRLTGAVEVRGHTVVTVTYARLSDKHRLQAWLELLAVAADGSVPVRGAVVVGRGRATRLRAPDQGAARTFLASAVELYDEAMTEPLPFPLTTSWAYARLRLRGRSRELALQPAKDRLGREFGNRYDELVWGGRLDLETLLAAPPTPADTRRAPDEDTRFGALAVAWWRDLDAHEEPGR